MGSSNTINPYQFCNNNDNDQDQDHDQDGYLSHNVNHHRGHVQTSSNINGGGVHVPSESSNDHQSVSNGVINHKQVQEEKVAPIRLTLTINEALLRRIEFALSTQKKKQENNINHQQQQQVMLSQQEQPSLKSKASNLPAKFFRVGSWSWESKNPGDLVVKFYHGKKRMVWEFLSGSMKKKMEIHWNQVSAINNYVDEDKNGRLEIELGAPPEYYQECKFQPQKHTQWEKTNDFTQGQAPICRRHTLLFSPGVLDEPLKKLLQYDNRLYNLNQQLFPIHNSHFFEPSFKLSYNVSNVSGCSTVPHSNHVPNLVQPTTSFVGHSESNVPMPGLEIFLDSNEVAKEVSYVNEITNGVLEQNGNNQIQDILLPPIKEQDTYEELEPIISDDQLVLKDVENQNFAEFATEQNGFNIVDSTSEQNHEKDIFDPFGAHSFIDEDDNVCGFTQLLFNDEFSTPEPFYWSSPEYNNMHGDNKGGDGSS